MYFSGQTDPKYGSKIKRILELSSEESSDSQEEQSNVEPPPESRCCNKATEETEEFLEFKTRVVRALETDAEFRRFAEEVMFNQFARK